MKHTILIVDDDIRLLKSFRRMLGTHFTIHLADGGPRGLEILDASPDLALIISDYKMPVMNGIEFLTEVRKRRPEVIRIMLTGFADLDRAVEAVNEGNVFRFLTKPCPNQVLASALKDGLRQYNLVRAEKELLEKTLTGTVEVLSEILALANPEAFERSGRIKRYVRALAENMDAEHLWQYEMACLLSHIGCVMVSEDTMRRYNHNEPLNPEERQTLDMFPSVGADLLRRIPRMDEVAGMIAHQTRAFDGSSGPADAAVGPDIPLGGRILKVVLDYDTNLQTNPVPKEAFKMLEDNAEAYDPEVLYYFEGVLGVESRYEVKKLPIDKLMPGMILHQEVRTVDDDAVVLRKNFELSQTVIERLQGFSRNNPMKEPVEVLVP